MPHRLDGSAVDPNFHNPVEAKSDITAIFSSGSSPQSQIDGKHASKHLVGLALPDLVEWDYPVRPQLTLSLRSAGGDRSKGMKGDAVSCRGAHYSQSFKRANGGSNRLLSVDEAASLPVEREREGGRGQLDIVAVNIDHVCPKGNPLTTTVCPKGDPLTTTLV
ncbi:hypothetical protein RvY_06136 [Ramazzottius varieornatus]|uniref:Uncharacterized protein n=1 Tax=Ramazzottius varieornatus TaxID=947166 RepID=A0A1D1UXI4_RAMVA|nr:hypothetical protein RvY_06136 [Ramazzottius varieornatus]